MGERDASESERDASWYGIRRGDDRSCSTGVCEEMGSSDRRCRKRCDQQANPGR
jgi:hypothetical protein